MRIPVLALIAISVGSHPSRAACLTPEQIDDRAIAIVLAETCGKRDQARLLESQAPACASERGEIAERLIVFRSNALHTGCLGDMVPASDETRPARSLSELLGR